ncbi:MAG: hypothetical protein HRU50_05025 [Winogradskyella sp.]|uniref:hypothetical protein n=1 Tax=Winogradskyella sp. TaxID=1883156 RepID=UPI0025D2E841|nr:hypothetical protein [Winogradskyella sp.]NRB59290.1 hypothetical protein [Winogradskyella sp.]
MNLLDYCVSLRHQGLNKNEIKAKLKEKDVDSIQIEHYLKKSDEIYLNQLVNNKQKQKSKTTLDRNIKTVLLILSLLLLVVAFYGYATIGLIGLFAIWSIVDYGSYRK